MKLKEKGSKPGTILFLVVISLTGNGVYGSAISGRISSEVDHPTTQAGPNPNFINRYAVPFITAAIYLGDPSVDINKQVSIMEKTQELTDGVLSQAKGEGTEEETYDYIIVGAGSAGSVLANKLTASGTEKVLLLEAGGDPNPVMDIPWARRLYESGEFMSWGFSTVKQDKACGWADGICPWPRGKALGGSSQVNHMMYNRGKAKDYERWANFTGDASWNWASIKELYNGLESYHGFYENEGREDAHGHTGEMYIGKVEWAPGSDFLLNAFKEKGIPVGDANDLDTFIWGFSKDDYNLRDGLRCGTYQAFLEPAMVRENLKVYRYAYATKVETEADEEGKLKATGITYQRHGIQHTAHATKEVIVSAGSTETPKLLMLSGIGPRDHLESLNITVLLDLPVGEYLQEHPSVNIGAWPDGFLVNRTFGADHNTTSALLEYLNNGTGPLNKVDFGDARVHSILHGYISSNDNADESWPDIHVYIGEQYTPELDKEEFFFNLDVARPASMGTIRLASADPKDAPIIDPKFHSDLSDAERLIDGIEYMMDVFMTSPLLQSIGIQPLMKHEGCKDLEGREYWKCVIYDGTSTVYHPASTARMGPNSSVAVLDSKLKVFGTSNLRVIDASVMPFVTSGNTNFPSIMIGAKGASIILNGE